jgi:hypothetical protein
MPWRLTLREGTRVRFTQPVDRYPHVAVSRGETGTVTLADPEMVAVRLDRYDPGLDEWDNEVHFYPPYAAEGDDWDYRDCLETAAAG